MPLSPTYSMAVWFLSDIHLSESTPEITQAFLRTLEHITQSQPQSVYILGDLFDYWLGDDMMSTFHKLIATHLSRLAQSCPVYYQHGNRDFLLGNHYAQLSGMTILPERKVIALGKHKILLEHGDLLCTDDKSYQYLRMILHHPITQTIYRILPRILRSRIAEKLRKKSQIYGAKKSTAITDVTPQAVENALEKYQVDTLIHGHTHRPNQHHHQHGTRLVLGDWHPEGIIIYYLDNIFNMVISSSI